MAAWSGYDLGSENHSRGLRPGYLRDAGSLSLAVTNHKKEYEDD